MFLKQELNDMQDIIIVGAGGFGREVYELIERLNAQEMTWNVLGFIDDNPDALKKYDIPASIIGSISDWQPSEGEMYAMAIAAPKTKAKVMHALRARGARFATLLSDKVTIGKRTHLGEGVIIFDYTITGKC